MEERLLIRFIRRLVQNEDLREETIRDTRGVCQREGLSAHAALVLGRIMPHLTLAGEASQHEGQFNWWAF
jgi:hypothetical protein